MQALGLATMTFKAGCAAVVQRAEHRLTCSDMVNTGEENFDCMGTHGCSIDIINCLGKILGNHDDMLVHAFNGQKKVA